MSVSSPPLSSPNDRLAVSFSPLPPADTISTFCAVTSDYFSLISLPFLSPSGLPPLLMAVHARNRQIRMPARVPDDDARASLFVRRMRLSRVRAAYPSRSCAPSFVDARRVLSGAHARHRRRGRANVYSTAAASAKPTSDFQLHRRVVSISGKSRFDLCPKSIRL